eukprot:Nk52_evm23s262 gene=Nk52_evmTU23s262
MSLEDPFFVVKSEVQQAVSSTEALFTRWKQLIQDHRRGSNADEIEWTANELKKTLRSIEWDLEDLEETIKIVEQNPAKFRLTMDEIAGRKGFVSQTRSRIDEIRRSLESGKNDLQRNALMNNKGKGIASAAGGGLHGQGSPGRDRYRKLDDAIQRDNSDFMREEQQRQMQMMRQQDQHLEQVGQQVGLLRNMGEDIGKELEEQRGMLDELDMDMDHTKHRLDNMLNKIDKVVQSTSDRAQNMCILGLIIALFALIIVFALLG